MTRPSSVAPAKSGEPSIPAGDPAPPAQAKAVPAPVELDDPLDVEPADFAARAREFFALAQADLARGKRARALRYAKLAADADPSVNAYRDLVADCTQPQIPSPESALFAHVEEAERRGDFTGALALLDEALHGSSRAPSVHNRRGLILATRLKRYADARAAYD